MHTIYLYRVHAAKLYPLKLFAIFLAAADGDFNVKFYTLITRYRVHKKVKRHLIFFYCCKATIC